MERSTRSLLSKTIQRGTLQRLLLAALLFGSAWRLDVPLFWAFLITSQLIFVFFMAPVVARDKTLYRERSTQNKKGGARAVLNKYQLVPLLIFVVAGLDVGHLHWGDTVPLWLAVACLVLAAVANLLLVWSVSANTFFSNTIRIQKARGHRVIDVGPYRIVRHPGYMGIIANYLFTGLALGSWLTVLPAIATAFVFVSRAAREDRFLHRELQGYGEYSSRVRYRLLPSVW